MILNVPVFYEITFLKRRSGVEHKARVWEEVPLDVPDAMNCSVAAGGKRHDGTMMTWVESEGELFLRHWLPSGTLSDFAMKLSDDNLFLVGDVGRARPLHVDKAIEFHSIHRIVATQREEAVAEAQRNAYRLRVVEGDVLTPSKGPYFKLFQGPIRPILDLFDRSPDGSELCGGVLTLGDTVRCSAALYDMRANSKVIEDMIVNDEALLDVATGLEVVAGTAEHIFRKGLMRISPSQLPHTFFDLRQQYLQMGPDQNCTAACVTLLEQAVTCWREDQRLQVIKGLNEALEDAQFCLELHSNLVESSPNFGAVLA